MRSDGPVVPYGISKFAEVWLQTLRVPLPVLGSLDRIHSLDQVQKWL